MCYQLFKLFELDYIQYYKALLLKLTGLNEKRETSTCLEPLISFIAQGYIFGYPLFFVQGI